MESLELFQDCNKVAHNIGKAGNSEKQNECASKSFDITSWVEIAKSDRRKGSECIVKRNDDNFIERHLR